MNFFHVNTDHLSEKLLFRDDEDFKAGMNFTAIIAGTLDVNVLAFILMSNHVHYVLEGAKELVLEFITRFKSLYSGYFCNKYKVKDYLKGVGVDIKEITDYDYLRKAVAYVVMNSVAAKICLEAGGYPWGSGACYYNSKVMRGIRVGDMSERARIRSFHSRQAVNPEWILTDEGYIDPRSFVKYRFVESLYGTPAGMHYNLVNSSKAKMRLESGAGLPAFRDQVLLEGLKDLCINLFNKKDQTTLSTEEMSELLKQLKRRFSADIKQLCRVVGLPYEEAARLIDRI